jgi:PAS domain S-box-containing protein
LKILFIILLIVFSLLSIGEVFWIIATYESRIELENQILNDTEEKNRMMIQRIDSYISERTIDMLNIGNDNQILQAVISSNSEFQNMTNPGQYIEEQNNTWSYTQPYVITPIMNQVIQNPAADRLRQAMNMEKVVFHNDVFGSLLATNSFGADVAGSSKPNYYDQAMETWFVEAKQNGLYIGGVSFDNTSGLISIPISVRMNDDNGNFMGVLLGEVAVNNVIRTISTQIESGNLQPTEYELLDDNGTVLYDSISAEKPFFYTYPADFMQNIKGQSGHFTYQFSDDSTPHFITYAHSTSSKITPTSNWILVTEYDPTQLLAPVKKLSDLLTLMLVIVVPVIAVGAVLAANKITKPIREISLATNEFSKDNATHLEPGGTDETKELAVNFNQMRESITNSKKQLKEHAEKYQNLLEISPNSVAIIDKNLRITFANNAFKHITGYSSEELGGMPISKLVAEKSLADFVKIHDAIDAGNEMNLNDQLFWSKKKDGTVHPVLVNTRTIHNVDNSIAGYLLTSKDQTDVIKELEQKDEYTVQLREYLDYIAKVDKQKDSFLSMISHELTTPLFPIKFHTEMLKNSENFGKLNEEQLNSVNEINQNAIRLEKLIGDILDAQKLEMNGMKFTKIDFELEEFMNKVVEYNSPLMLSKSIELINSTKDKIRLSSDPDRLHQVFTNLIANSVDFVPDKTGKIEIRAGVQEKDVLFYVKDNGIGIPKEKQLGLFKKFYQIDTSVTRKHRGSGLGLCICKGIIEGLGGKIWLESTVGLGTIVYFTIPKKERV